MRKLFLLTAAMVAVLTLAACGDKETPDTTAPVITVVSSLDTTFDEDTSEPVWGTYFTIEDDIDGVMQMTNSMLTEDVDMTTPGTYTVTLTVSDAAGNEATESITITIEEVIVEPQGDLIAKYEGIAPVGMGDSGTYVVINFYDNGTWDLATSSPRGGGTFTIDSGVIELTYTAEHPEDGGEWVLSGTITTDDVTDPLTVIVIDPIEYEINMGTPVAMDVGTTTFGIVIGSKVEITKVPDLVKSFFMDEEEPDWTTYFTAEDEIDGTIAVTEAMITDTVDMTIAGMYTVSITVTNTSGNATTTTIMVFVTEPLYSYVDYTTTDEVMLIGAVVKLAIFNDTVFKAYVNDIYKAEGTYAIDGSTITFTFTFPTVDYLGAAVPDIVGTIDTPTLEAATIITTAVTEVCVPMGPFSGMTIDYGALFLARAPIATYEGIAAVGMGGAGTSVTIHFYSDDTFDLWTSKLRDTGVYEIVDGAINLTYDTDHPDGGDWVLTGTITTEDVTDVLTVIVIDPVEYAIDMGAGPVVMDVGAATFGIVIGPKAIVTKVMTAQKTFTVGDAELDWTTYFTINDDLDGDIPVTVEMLTDNIDMSVAGTYTIDLTVTNSSGNVSTSSVMIFVNEPVT